MPHEYAVTVTYGVQRGEIVKSCFSSIKEAKDFAEILHSTHKARVINEGGMMPTIQIWHLVKTL